MRALSWGRWEEHSDEPAADGYSEFGVGVSYPKLFLSLIHQNNQPIIHLNFKFMKKLLLKKFLIFIGISLSCATISFNSYAQNRQVTGKVSDKDDGLPLPGVTIKVKGTNNAATTNNEGLYTINATQGSTLVFSFLGYGEREIAVSPSGKLDVSLSKVLNNLNEVVVIGYGTARRKDVVGAVDVVRACNSKCCRLFFVIFLLIICLIKTHF